MARPAQRKGCQISRCQITGRSGGSRVLAKQEFSQGSRRVSGVAWQRFAVGSQLERPSKLGLDGRSLIIGQGCVDGFSPGELETNEEALVELP